MKVVLVVEDDAVIRRAVSEILLEAGYGVCEAWSTDLIPFVPRLHLVISDVVAAERDLGSVTAWSRALTDRFNAPVILLTGRSDVARQTPASLGVADVMAKPFNIDDLLARVERATLPTERAA